MGDIWGQPALCCPNLAWGGGSQGLQVLASARSKHLALGHIPSPPISFREQGRSQIRWDKGGFYSGLKVIAVSPSVLCFSLLIAGGLLAQNFLSRLRAGLGPRGCPGDKAWGSEGWGQWGTGVTGSSGASSGCVWVCGGEARGAWSRTSDWRRLLPCLPGLGLFSPVVR